MNKFKIFKYHLEEPETTLDLPIGAVVRHVHEQSGAVTIWIEGAFDTPVRKSRTFVWVGTGHPIAYEERQYLGSVHVDQFVWHVFEVEDLRLISA